MQNELASILKWAAVGVRVHEGIMSMINTMIDRDCGKITPAECTQVVANIDKQITEAVENENALFADTESIKPT